MAVRSRSTVARAPMAKAGSPGRICGLLEREGREKRAGRVKGEGERGERQGGIGRNGSV